MNVEAIKKLPEAIKKKVNEKPTNTKFIQLDKIPGAAQWRIKYPYTKLPKEFNGRKIWPGIDNNIFDQGNCGSCWAFASCSLLSDRYLILSKGKVNVVLSPTRLLLCDVGGLDIEYAYKDMTKEGQRLIMDLIAKSRRKNNSACFGNTLLHALDYLYVYGTCTTTCLPYKFDYNKKVTKLFSPVYSQLPHITKTRIDIGKSDHNTFKDPISNLDYIKNTYTGLPPENSPWIDYNLTEYIGSKYIPSCGNLMGGVGDMCINWNHDILTNQILQGTPARFYRLGIWYVINLETLEETNEAIRQDIYKWGPVISVMKIYQNFYEFDSKTEIYSWDKKGEFLSAHAIEIVGWGIENNTKYWWVKNSWGRDWGDNGYFKIKRGVDECAIESNVAAGLPDFFTPAIAGGALVTRNKSGKEDVHQNIYDIDIITPIKKPSYGKWEFKTIDPYKLYKNRDIASLFRLGLDFSLFSNTLGEVLSPYLDFVHNYTGGIDPFTGFSRRAMLMHTGMDFTPPISVNDVNFSKSFYAGKNKVKRINAVPSIFISNYIFYMTIAILIILIIAMMIRKYL